MSTEPVTGEANSESSARAPAPAQRTTATGTSYRDVLLHIDGSARCLLRIDLAAAIAREHGAHLVGLAATGLLTPYAEVESNPSLYKQAATRRRDECALAVTRFEQRATALGVPSFESRVVDHPPEYAIADASRYADLVVIAQSDPADPDHTTIAAFPEQVLMDACRPIVIVPNVGAFASIGSDVLVAWDGSRPAARAVTDAMPFLTRAGRVRVQRLNPSTAPDARQSGREIVAFLHRHGVTAELVDAATPLSIGDALLSRAADYGCDLLVMGGYGHSRFREVVLGGTTRTILESMTVPVLMSRY